MADLKDKDRGRALMATGEELAGLVHHPSADVLLALLENPALDALALIVRGADTARLELRRNRRVCSLSRSASRRSTPTTMRCWSTG